MLDKAKQVFDYYVEGIKRYLDGDGSGEKFCRRIEECCDIPEQGADDFRRMFVTLMWRINYDGKTITWDYNSTMAKGIRKFLNANPNELIPESIFSLSKKHRSIDDSWESQL